MKSSRIRAFFIAAAAAVFLTACGGPVDTVRQAKVPGSDFTYAEALDKNVACSNTKWDIAEDQNANKLVRYTCTVAMEPNFWDMWRVEKLESINTFSTGKQHWQDNFNRAQSMQQEAKMQSLTTWRERFLQSRLDADDANRAAVEAFAKEQSAKELAFVMEFRVPEKGEPRISGVAYTWGGKQLRGFGINEYILGQVLNDSNKLTNFLTNSRNTFLRGNNFGAPQFVGPKVNCFSASYGDDPNFCGEFS